MEGIRKKQPNLVESLYVTLFVLCILFLISLIAGALDTTDSAAQQAGIVIEDRKTTIKVDRVRLHVYRMYDYDEGQVCTLLIAYQYSKRFLGLSCKDIKE